MCTCLRHYLSLSQSPKVSPASFSGHSSTKACSTPWCHICDLVVSPIPNATNMTRNSLRKLGCSDYGLPKDNADPAMMPPAIYPATKDKSIVLIRKPRRTPETRGNESECRSFFNQNRRPIPDRTSFFLIDKDSVCLRKDFPPKYLNFCNSNISGRIFIEPS